MLDENELLRLADKLILAGASITDAGNALKAHCEKDTDSDPRKRHAKMMKMSDEDFRKYKDGKLADSA